MIPNDHFYTQKLSELSWYLVNSKLVCCYLRASWSNTSLPFKSSWTPANWNFLLFFYICPALIGITFFTWLSLPGHIFFFCHFPFLLPIPYLLVRFMPKCCFFLDLFLQVESILPTFKLLLHFTCISLRMCLGYFDFSYSYMWLLCL